VSGRASEPREARAGGRTAMLALSVTSVGLALNAAAAVMMLATRPAPTTGDPGRKAMAAAVATPKKASAAASPPSTSFGWRRSQP